MGHYSVKNWSRFQHYKEGRTPPWIKLYNDLLDDYQFGLLSDETKWHLTGIWLLASRYNNEIPDDPKWISMKISASSNIDFTALVSSGFLDHYASASTMLAPCKRSGILEEKRREENKNPLTPKGGKVGVAADKQPPHKPSGFVAFWAEWPSHPRKKAQSKCLRHWQHAELEAMASVIVDSVRRHKESRDWQKEDGQFIPGPLPWLRDEGWEADVSVAAAQAAAGENGFVMRAPTPEEIAIALGTEGEDED